MKPLLLPVVFTLLINQSFSQTVDQPSSLSSFKKKSWQIGVRDWRQGGNLIGIRNTLQLHAGYYLANQLAVGISGTWGREGTSWGAFHDITLGPYARYQFTSTRISPFVDVSYQIGRRSSWDDAFTFSSIGIQSAQISPGVSVGVTRFLRAELNYHFQWIFQSGSGFWGEYIGQPQLGLTYLFNRK
ncbi:hypothetical protein GCM10028805_03820 [Spirosoma harenae]